MPTRKDVLARLLAQPIYVKAEGWLCHKVANCTDSVPLTRTVNQGLEENPSGLHVTSCPAATYSRMRFPV